jgi:transposase
VAAFTGTLATQVVQLRPRDPESKGIVERRNGFFETSFMPGRVFTSPADFNAQFTGWLERANSRVVRTIRARPADLIEADRAAMLPLPAIPPPLGWCHQVRLGRDYYVRLAASDYSVDPTAIGRLVEVTADLERVRVRAGGQLAADHARVWARGTTVTDPGHVRTARRLREEFRQPPAPGPGNDLLRDLADYDRAFGLITADGGAAQ